MSKPLNQEQNKLLVRRFYELFNSGRTDCLSDFVGPEYTEVHEGVRHQVGLEGAKAHILGIRTAFADFHLLVDRQIAEDDWVVSCITASGHHQSPWLGMKPTGKLVRFTGVNVDRVVSGRIVEHGGAANLLGPLLEIGAVRVVD